MPAVRPRSRRALVPVACLLLCGSVWAGTPVVLDGVSLEAPAGFERVPAGEATYGDDLRLTEGVPGSGEPRRVVFRTGDAAHPDSELVVARIALGDPSQVRGVRNLQRYLLANLHVTQRPFELLVADGRVELTPTYRDGFDCIEMRHDGSAGPRGVDEPAMRALVASDESHLVVLALLDVDGAGQELDPLWQEVTASLSLEPPGAFARTALLHGAALVLALLLLLFVLRRVARRRLDRDPHRAYGVQGEVAWGHTMLAPPLRPAGGPPAARSPARVRLGRPELVYEPVVAGPDAVPPAPEALPASEPETVVPPPPTAAAPARGGLRRTLPTTGRFSEG